MPAAFEGRVENILLARLFAGVWRVRKAVGTRQMQLVPYGTSHPAKQPDVRKTP